MTADVLQGTLVLTDRLAECSQVVIEDGAITDVITGEPRYIATADYGDAYIAPGLIDVHVHGIAGAGVMDGTRESLEIIARRFAAHGVTGFLATTVTDRLDLTRTVIGAAREYMDNPADDGASILGIHLEGPWISVDFKGMQNEAHILQPVEETVRAIVDLGGGCITRVSIAPEVPGAHRIIRLLRERGIFVSIAHTAATYEQALEAIDLGASHVTHCFNAMTALHHRKPGVVGAALLHDDLYTELIADGVHIHPAVMRLLIRVKGRERVMLVTDSLSAADMPDGTYAMGGKEVFVRQGRAQLEDGTLASSTLTMEAGVRNLVRMCGAPIVDAFYMGATTPAEAMGFGASKGRIRVGYDADLAVLDGEFRPLATWIAGAAVSSLGDPAH